MKVNAAQSILKKTILFSLTVIAAVIVWLVFMPRHYDVPQLKTRSSTHYWNLTTGSRIAYTLVPAQHIKRPYPVIFLQGGPGGFISDRNIAVLGSLSEEGYAVYLYDQIGSGYSARLKNVEDYTADRHKRDLEEIIKTIGAQKVILIGQSWGAMLAVLLATDNPDKIDKLIVTGPGPILPVQTKLADEKAPDSLELRAPMFMNAQANLKSQNIRIRFVTYLATTWNWKLASDKEMDDYATYLGNELNKSTVCDASMAPKGEAGNGFYAQIMTVHSFNQVPDARAKIKNCTFPVLVMKGQCDNQKWGYTHEYLDLFPNSKLIMIPDAGHSISIEKPEIYLRTIRNFLKE